MKNYEIWWNLMKFDEIRWKVSFYPLDPPGFENTILGGFEGSKMSIFGFLDLENGRKRQFWTILDDSGIDLDDFWTPRTVKNAKLCLILLYLGRFDPQGCFSKSAVFDTFFVKILVFRRKIFLFFYFLWEKIGFFFSRAGNSFYF